MAHQRPAVLSPGLMQSSSGAASAAAATPASAAGSYVLSQPATPATPHYSAAHHGHGGHGHGHIHSHSRGLSGGLAPPPMPPPSTSLHHQLSRLEHEAMHLSRQYEIMMGSLQDSQKQMSGMTVHYVASLQQAARSSSSSMGILIETHTSLIRKMLIAVQQTQGIEALEKHIGVTRVALTELERGVEALLADDALQATRTQLQQELHRTTGAAGGDLDGSFAAAGDGTDTEAMLGRLELEGREQHEPPEDEDEEIILQPLQQYPPQQLQQGVISSRSQTSTMTTTARLAPGSPHRHAAQHQRPHTPTPQHPQLEAL